MRVAIMGAGMSGLACAITLEQNGVQPTIFESRSRVGDRFINAEAILNIIDRPINNAPEYISKKYGIELKPLIQIDQMTFFSKNNSGLLSGTLGWSNIRGRHEASYENQLASQVKSQIVYSSKHSYDELVRDFSHVVLATGDGEYALRMNNYTKDFTVSLKGATVEGSFSTSHICCWLNYDFAPKGYAYLIPFSEREAHIVIAFPEYNEKNIIDIHSLWEKFYRTVCRDMNQDLMITDNFEVNGYIIGRSKKPRLENTYFTGNCFGSLMPAFGFGQFASILTGIYAAQDICGLSDYQSDTRPLYKAYENSIIIRRYMEGLDNDKLDRYVQLLNLKLIGRLFGGNIRTDTFKLLSYLLRPVVYIKRV